MDAERFKSYLAEQVRGAKDKYLKDLEALDEGALRSSPGGTARTPYDFTYEVVYVNRRIAARLRGEDPGPFSGEGWIRAPEDCQNKVRMATDLRESTDAVLKAWEALPSTELEKKIPVANSETTPIEMMTLCSVHLNYHDAQLNFLQTLLGDDEMHWG